MAVSYLHRLIVSGTRQGVRAFRDEIYREYPRTVARKSWTEVVPFSFASLYEMAPAARRIEKDAPCDPYQLSVWPIRPTVRGRAELRYQFQTRNVEMFRFIRALSRARPALSFILLTFCLDDSSIESFRLSGRTERKWTLPGRRHEQYWQRARVKFGLKGDDVYEDDVAEHWTEEAMLHDALSHWDRSGVAAGSRRRYQWWNQIPLRDLATERDLAIVEIGDALASVERRAARSR